MAPCRTCALAVFASCRCGANMAHIRQSRPDYGLGFQAQALKISSAVPSCLDAVIEGGEATVAPCLTCTCINYSATRDRLLPLATQDCYSRKATMGRELMAPKTDRTTRIPSGVASPVTTNYAAKGPVFINVGNAGNLKNLAHSVGLATQDCCSYGL